jgi:C4-dicarboxylate-specific signal transduction histidine kinase
MSKFESVGVQPWPRFGDYCLLDTPDARVRLAATTTMASALAHEVNQPLSAAANYMHACASRLRSRGEGHEDLLAMIEHASNETLKAGEMIRRMRSFIVSGKVVGRRENLRTMVERVLATLAAGDDDVDVEIVRTIPLTEFVIGDRIQIEQILSNLLRNACEALDGCATRRIAIGSTRLGREIVVRIEDSGPGLPGGAPEDLFAPHFTTKSDGRGLGLAICKAIVEGHGGRIWAETIAQGGAAFSFALPAADPPGNEQGA